ncbi:MAG: hypothetical protein KDB02_05160 [Acidimicrobiales bacterium]|nr:hypothetical protein [Acidimicrobiales bacterium]
MWRNPARQANLARAVRHFDIHPLDNAAPVGRRLAASDTSDLVGAHLTVMAESLGTFILTTDPDDMTRLNARFESY